MQININHCEAAQELLAQTIANNQLIANVLIREEELY